MGHVVVGLVIESSNKSLTRTVQLTSDDGKPVRVTSWSIESDWLYVVFTGQRRAYRLHSADYEVDEIIEANNRESRIVT